MKLALAAAAALVMGLSACQTETPTAAADCTDESPAFTRGCAPPAGEQLAMAPKTADTEGTSERTAAPAEGSILEVVRGNTPGLKTCAAADTSGRAMIELTIDATGKVTAATLSASSLGPQVEACVTEQVRAWRFSPSSEAETQVSVPVVFSAQ